MSHPVLYIPPSLLHVTPLTQKALDAAGKRLRLFKRAAMDAKEIGWELHPEELWETEDDAALALIESAMAEMRGERPLFGVEP